MKTISKLDNYKWCGHSGVVGKYQVDWQDRDDVLKWFGQTEENAKKSYRSYIKKGIELGKRPDLTGGGLIRSMGGWSAVKSMRKNGEKTEGDDRILGSGSFVSEMICQADEKIKYQLPSADLGERIEKRIQECCKKENITVTMLRSGSRISPLPKIRKIIALILVNRYGLSLAETARYLGISTSGIAQILRRR
ncbi:MAG: hypothetical protein KJ737_00940 [Proteobacteria bacterium]|nr:hypothetical protein [Pseudomonadota bacterium]